MQPLLPPAPQVQWRTAALAAPRQPPRGRLHPLRLAADLRRRGPGARPPAATAHRAGGGSLPQLPPDLSPSRASQLPPTAAPPRCLGKAVRPLREDSDSLNLRDRCNHPGRGSGSRRGLSVSRRSRLRGRAVLFCRPPPPSAAAGRGRAQQRPPCEPSVHRAGQTRRRPPPLPCWHQARRSRRGRRSPGGTSNGSAARRRRQRRSAATRQESSTAGRRPPPAPRTVPPRTGAAIRHINRKPPALTASPPQSRGPRSPRRAPPPLQPPKAGF